MFGLMRKVGRATHPAHRARGFARHPFPDARSIRRALRNPSRVGFVGDERGDRASIERVPVLTGYLLTSGATSIITQQMPRGNVWLALRLNLRGQLVGAGSASGTVLPDGPSSLFNVALTTDLDGDVIQPMVSARALYRYAQFMAGTAGEITAPTVTSSTTTDFNVVLTIPFADSLMVNPSDSALDTRRYENVTLSIQTGVIADIVSSATNVTLGACYADIEVVRISPEVQPPLDLVEVLPQYKRYAPIIPGTDTQFKLDRIPTLALKRLAVLATTSSTAGSPFTGTASNGVIDTGRIDSDRRTHFGGPAGGVSYRTWQGGSKDFYGLETWPTGWYVIDFAKDGSLNSALASGDKASLDLTFTYLSTATTPQLSVFQAGARQLRELQAA